MGFVMKSRVAVLFCVLFAACGNGESNNDDGELTFDPVVPVVLPEADEATFDVEWAPHVQVAQQDDVLADIEDLNAHDGVFRVREDSPLLEGLEVDDTVVWPQVGLLTITSLTPSGGFVDVGTQWATFADAMTEANIEFDHELTAGVEGAVLGVAPAVAPSSDDAGVLVQPLFDSPVQFTNDGVSYSGGNYQVAINATESSTKVKFTAATSGAFSTEVDATVTGLRAQGSITKTSSDGDPVTEITFPNIRIRGTAKLMISEARGSTSVVPPAMLMFPFMIGPLPAFVALEVRVALESTITAEAKMELSVDFDMGGTLTMRHGPDGPSIGGGITSFDTSNFRSEGNTSITMGQRIGLDSPRLSFGLGRPGIGTAAIYTTVSAEAVANVVVAPFSDDYCLVLSAGSAVLYGGELSVLGISYGVERSLGGIRSPNVTRGNACPGS